MKQLILSFALLISAHAVAQTPMAWYQTGFVNGQPTAEQPAEQTSPIPLLMLPRLPACQTLISAGTSTPDNAKVVLCTKASQ